MFYKVWSGVTKHIKAVLQQQRRPIEVPQFGIFTPVEVEKGGKRDRSPSEIETLLGNSFVGKKTQAKSLDAQFLQVKLILHSDFLTKCGDNLSIPSQSDPAHATSNIIVLSKTEQDTDSTVASLFNTVSDVFHLKNLQQLNLNAIAKACSTDVHTVEAILKEIIATMAHLVEKGTSINVNFKIGLFNIRNGHMGFKQFHDSHAEPNRMSQDYTKGGEKLRSNTVRYMYNLSHVQFDVHSQAGSATNGEHNTMIGSMHRGDLSVRTPSLGGQTLGNQTMTTATGSSYVHLSNPNPQKGKLKFKSVRDAGYQTGFSPLGNQTARAAGLTLIHSPYVDGKFGKRVYMGNYQLSDKDVFDLHMQQIRMKDTLHAYDKAIKVKEEQEFTKFVQDQLRKDLAKQEHIHKLMKHDFVEENMIKRLTNEEGKKEEIEKRKKEKYDHFPFLGSDTVEKHREELRHRQRQEFLQYINSDAYKTTQASFNKAVTPASLIVSPLTEQLSQTALSARLGDIKVDKKSPSRI